MREERDGHERQTGFISDRACEIDQAAVAAMNTVEHANAGNHSAIRLTHQGTSLDQPTNTAK
jgi:hypothetical protein